MFIDQHSASLIGSFLLSAPVSKNHAGFNLAITKASETFFELSKLLLVNENVNP